MAVTALFNRNLSSQQTMREGLEKVMKILKAWTNLLVVAKQVAPSRAMMFHRHRVNI